MTSTLPALKFNIVKILEEICREKNFFQLEMQFFRKYFSAAFGPLLY
jgi:hypothetical protein